MTLDPKALEAAWAAQQKALLECTDEHCPSDHLEAGIEAYPSALPAKAVVEGLTDEMVDQALAAWNNDLINGPPEQDERSAMRAALSAGTATPGGEKAASETDRLVRASQWLQKRWGEKDPNTAHIRQLADYEAYLTADGVPGMVLYGWQPIETAPTNRAILIHVPNLDYYGNDGVYAGMLVDMGTGKRWMTFGWAIGRDLGSENMPVAWRSIPLSSASTAGA